VIITSAKDGEPLRISPVTLAAVECKASIAGFYAAVLWLFLRFHFNLFLQLYLLARRL
jgi:hypothetical protein